MGEVSLPNLTDLSEEDARVLATVRGPLYLGVPTISAVAARQLADHRGVLCLDSVVELPDAVADLLGNHQGSILLPSCRILSDRAIARLLSGNKARVTLGLESLSESQARLLSAYDGALGLGRVRSLEAGAAEALIHYKGQLELVLTGLCTVDANALSRRRARLALGLGRRGEVMTLDRATAAEVSRTTGPLRLWHVNGDPCFEVAIAPLCEFHGDLALSLDGPLTKSVAKTIARPWGSLEVSMRHSPLGGALAMLARQRGDLSIRAVGDCVLESPEAFAAHQGGKLNLSGSLVLTVASATALAKHEGPLEISPDSKMAQPAEEVVAALCNHDGSLDVPAHWLSERSADAFSRHLGGLTFFAGVRFNCDLSADGSARGDMYEYEWMPIPAFRRVVESGTPLHLCGEITEEMAHVLVEHNGDLALDRLPRSESSMKLLLMRRGRIFFSRAPVVETVAAATLFASRQNMTSTCASSHLIGAAAPEIAATLAKRTGELALPNLQYIKADALRNLALKADVRLPPLDSLYILDNNGRDIPPSEVVSLRFMKSNAENQPVPQLPDWHSWDQLLKPSAVDKCSRRDGPCLEEARTSCSVRKPHVRIHRLSDCDRPTVVRSRTACQR